MKDWVARFVVALTSFCSIVSYDLGKATVRSSSD